jgi:RNA polymerase sigma-70 factor, ECF subfamily
VIPDEDLNEEVGAILAEHGAALRRYLRGRSLHLPADVADEVMNDVLLVVAVKRRRGQEIGQLKPYLFRVARNSAIDRLKEKFRKAEIIDQETVDGSDNTIDVVAEVDAAEDLRRAIRELPAQQRRVVGCRYLRGFTIAETAEMLGIAQGTVGSTTTAAIKNLREIMKRVGGTWDGDIR